MVHDDGPVGLDGIRVEFDDERVVSDAGVMLVATVAQRLGVEGLAGQLVRLRRDRPGAANAGRKVMALIYAMVLGADSIDDTDVLRAGRTGRLLGGWLPAPSTLGTFLRAFTFGHVRQLDALLGRALERAWKAGAGPGAGRLVIDVDSFVGEVCGRLKQGAAYGYTRLLGYHPILATRADTREALHIRLRRGSANTQKGMLRFTEELIARVQRAGASGVKLLRADSGFWSTKVFERLEQARWPSCGPTGGTSRSSPTAARTSCSSRPSIVITPSSSRSSQTSKNKRWRTSPPGISTPTPPGPCLPSWRTTCCAGRSCSGSPTRPSAPPEPCAADRLASPAASPDTHAAGRCTSPPAGPGTATTSARSTRSARSPPPPDRGAREPATTKPALRPPGATAAALTSPKTLARKRRGACQPPLIATDPPTFQSPKPGPPVHTAEPVHRWIRA